MDRHLTRFRLKHGAANAENIPNICFLKITVYFLSHAVPGNITLEHTLHILNMAKRRLSHNAFRHHPARHRYLLSSVIGKCRLDLLTVMRYIIFYGTKRILPRCLQLFQLFATDTAQLVFLLFCDLFRRLCRTNLSVFHLCLLLPPQYMRLYTLPYF